MCHATATGNIRVPCCRSSYSIFSIHVSLVFWYVQGEICQYLQCDTHSLPYLFGEPHRKGCAWRWWFCETHRAHRHDSHPALLRQRVPVLRARSCHEVHRGAAQRCLSSSCHACLPVLRLRAGPEGVLTCDASPVAEVVVLADPHR
jgi:hypothetical protein